MTIKTYTYHGINIIMLFKRYIEGNQHPPAILKAFIRAIKGGLGFESESQKTKIRRWDLHMRSYGIMWHVEVSINGGTSKIIHFSGIFHEINHLFLGTPMAMETSM